MHDSQSKRALAALCAAAAVLALLVSGCGGSGEETSRPAPPAAEFPSAQGKTIDQLLRGSGAKASNLVVAPAAAVFDVGENRYPFGVFTVANEQVDDADVALYFAKDSGGPVQGPLPAQ